MTRINTKNCLFIIFTILLSQKAFSYNTNVDESNHQPMYWYIEGIKIPIPVQQDVMEVSDLQSRHFLQNGFLGSMLEEFGKSKRYDSMYEGLDLSSTRNRKTNHVLDHIFSAVRADEVSINCLNDTEQLILDILGKKQYAKEMLDADAKLPSGLLRGHWLWFGNYEECKAAQSAVSSTGHRFTGQYCLTSLNINMGSYPLTLGLCVPDSCSDSDVYGLVSAVSMQEEGSSLVGGVSCDDDIPYSSGAIVALVISGILGLFILTGTLFDILTRCMNDWTKKKSSLLHSNGHVNHSDVGERTGLLSSTSLSVEDHMVKVPQGVTVSRCPKLTSFMTSFSIVKNTEKLLNTSTASSPLSSLNGMRVISMWWVILGHSYEIVSASPNIQNGLDTVKIRTRFSFQAVVNGTFSVDSFFFMSGLLVTYLCLKDISDKNGKTRWAMFYFHRFWRLTPAYAFCIMIFTTLFQHMTHGPASMIYFKSVLSKMVTSCQSSWWANLLYINSFYPDSGDIGTTCMAWSWYLANDMQFFIVSPLIIIIFLRNKKLGIGACIFLIVSCSFIRIMTAFEYGIHIPSQTPTKHAHDAYARNPLYNRPYTRMAPYVVGILLGYTLHKNNCRSNLSKVSVCIGWIIAIVAGLLPVYGIYSYMDGSGSEMFGFHDASLEVSAIYFGFSRLSWSVAVAWVIYACATGYGGPVNKILSWSVWAPLGRLTYCAYLVHPIVIVGYLLNLTSPYHFTDIGMVHMYTANLVLSYLVAYVVSMIIEAPMMGLEKVVFKR